MANLFSWICFVWATGHKVYDGWLRYFTSIPEKMRLYVEYKKDQLEEMPDEVWYFLMRFRRRVLIAVSTLSSRLDSHFVRSLDEILKTSMKFVFFWREKDGGFGLRDILRFMKNAYLCLFYAFVVMILSYSYKGEKIGNQFFKYVTEKDDEATNEAEGEEATSEDEDVETTSEDEDEETINEDEDEATSEDEDGETDTGAKDGATSETEEDGETDTGAKDGATSENKNAKVANGTKDEKVAIELKKAKNASGTEKGIVASEHPMKSEMRMLRAIWESERAFSKMTS